MSQQPINFILSPRVKKTGRLRPVLTSFADAESVPAVVVGENDTNLLDLVEHPLRQGRFRLFIAF